ncbi:hypothetical protein JTE90_000544 [Oedothorax gibbosus]|uniref:Uncharacterized protein n=1 Tax=Oedothorax gibbosus TaxID=931172 RepID=A0AAV6VXL0_9ARAC|nr:hypothetical protein JTE90_000544 [Oedothorax gibbosus]
MYFNPFSRNQVKPSFKRSKNNFPCYLHSTTLISTLLTNTELPKQVSHYCLPTTEIASLSPRKFWVVQVRGRQKNSGTTKQQHKNKTPFSLDVKLRSRKSTSGLGEGTLPSCFSSSS